MPKRHPTITPGSRFGRLIVIGRDQDARRRIKFICKCDCGATGSFQGTRLSMGVTKSCGCLKFDARKTHGHASHGRLSPTYTSWSKMTERCTNPKQIGYVNYGGRGITVCSRWLQSFENFLADMGERPKGTTIDRYPNNDGNYEPGNCRWATKAEQTKSRRDSHLLTLGGRTMNVSEWSRHTGIPTATLHNRLRNKWPVDKALSAPIETKFRTKNQLAELDALLASRSAAIQSA